MPAKKNVRPRVPGEKVEPSQMPPQADEVKEKTDIVEDDDSDQEITLKKSELESLVASMVDQQLVSQVKAARDASPNKKGVAYEDLPDQSEVDATKLQRSVLTKQGYVVPLVSEADRIRMQKKLADLN